MPSESGPVFVARKVLAVPISNGVPVPTFAIIDQHRSPGAGHGRLRATSPLNMASHALPHAMPTGDLGSVSPPPKTIVPLVVIDTDSPAFRLTPEGVNSWREFSCRCATFGPEAPE